MYSKKFVNKVNNAIKNIIKFCEQYDFEVEELYGKYTIRDKYTEGIIGYLYTCNIVGSSTTYKSYEAFNDGDIDIVCYITEKQYKHYGKGLIDLSQYLDKYALLDRLPDVVINNAIQSIKYLSLIDYYGYSYSDLLSVAQLNDYYINILFDHCEEFFPEDYYQYDYEDGEFIMVDYKEEVYLLYTHGLNYQEYMNKVKSNYSDITEQEILGHELLKQYEFLADEEDIFDDLNFIN
ncbi:MAG: hypothetical protein LUG12_12900 [Erysipelotrichaceae bacterium]|nr:hypothetical protein [Erysipelotrichaceae bacterium]